MGPPGRLGGRARSRFARASSAIAKYSARSALSPIRFQVLPVREISDSRVTTPAMIHCCSVASSRQLFCSPLSSRISHCRSIVVGASSGPSGRISSSSSDSPRGRDSTDGNGLGVGGGRPPASLPPGPPGPPGPAPAHPLGPDGGDPLDDTPTLVIVRLRILNMWPQLVHFTVTPPGFTRASSSSYSRSEEHTSEL